MDARVRFARALVGAGCEPRVRRARASEASRVHGLIWRYAQEAMAAGRGARPVVIDGAHLCIVGTPRPGSLVASLVD